MDKISLKKNDCNYLDVTRFIGIYLVIFAHFTFPHQYSFFSGISFSFHMPLFFVVSGILHRPVAFSKDSFIKVVIGLLVPYLIYNLIGAAYFLLEGRSVAVVWHKILQTLTVERPITGASWFFIALFWIKFFALFLTTKKRMIIFSLVCIVGLLMFDSLGTRYKYDNVLLLRTALGTFPFFVFGYLIKNELTINIKPLLKIVLILVFMAANIFLIYEFGSSSLGGMIYGNLLAMYAMAIFGTMAVIYFSQLVLPYVKCSFVKDISRGTMIIVGLHFFLMYDVLGDYIFGPMPLRYIIPFSIAILLFFYVLIKLTYNRFPILYGKWDYKKKKR